MKKQITKFMTTSLLALAGCALLAPTAKAQNASVNPGDLLLGFQNPGGATGSDQVVLVDLGAASLYRGPGAVGNLTNIVNIGSLLSNTFGSNWYDLTTLYMGSLSAWNSNTASSTLLNSDPSLTVYVSQSRTALGTEGSAQSGGFSNFGSTALSGISGAMIAINGNLEAAGQGAALAMSNSSTTFDDQNPFDSFGNQSTAYANNIAGGTQYQFGSGAFGTLGGVNAEGALDLYRIQGKNNITGQYGLNAAKGVGEYEGSVVIDQSGNVSFIQTAAVPEPSTNALLGIAAIGGLYFARVRRKQSQAI